MQSLAQTHYSVQSPDYPTAAAAQARRAQADDQRRYPVGGPLRPPPGRTAPVQHYATYRNVEGIATLVQGGWTFEGDSAANSCTWLVSSKDADLCLLGRKDLVDAQRAADTMAGGLAAICCGR